MDGYLKIKTKIDNSDVDKQIKNLEDKIKKMQTENNRSSKEQASIEAEIHAYEELAQNAEEYRYTLKKLEQEKANMVKMDPNLAVQSSPEYSALESQLESIRQKYINATKELDKQAPKVDKLYIKLDKVKSKQTENNAKINQFRNEISKINTNNIKKGIDSVGKSLSNQIIKVGKLAFAVVGIRSAWFAVSRAINLVNRYDKQTATDFEYMGYVIAQALIPVVQQLVKALYNVLTYVNAITTAWFGFNLFANASVESFQKMKSSAKDIQKSLQGFDEMNVISNNSSNIETAGVSPSMDVSGIQGEVPKWLQWIIDNKDIIISTLAGIEGGIIAIKLGVKGIIALGIGLIISGIVETIQGVINLIKDPSWENFASVLAGLTLILTGVAIAMLAVNAANPVAWIVLAIAAVTALVAAIIKYWDSIKEVLGKVGQWIYDNVIKPIGDFFANLWEKIKSIFSKVGDFFKEVFSRAYEAIKRVFSSIGSFFSGIWSNIRSIFSNIGQKIGDAVGKTFKSAVNAVLQTIENVLNTPIRAINGLIDVINKVPGINLGKLNTFNLPRLAKGGIISQPTQAIIGEAGAEVVMPLENNLEWIDKLADMISNKISGNGNVNVYLDGRLIQRQIQKRSQQVSFATNS